MKKKPIALILAVTGFTAAPSVVLASSPILDALKGDGVAATSNPN